MFMNFPCAANESPHFKVPARRGKPAHAAENRRMLTRVLCAAVLLGLAASAHAEWVSRVADGIMGTRITVELWSEDKAKAEEAIEAVLEEMRTSTIP